MKVRERMPTLQETEENTSLARLSALKGFLLPVLVAAPQGSSGGKVPSCMQRAQGPSTELPHGDKSFHVGTRASGSGVLPTAGPASSSPNFSYKAVSTGNLAPRERMTYRCFL